MARSARRHRLRSRRSTACRVQDLSQAVLVGDRLHDVEGAKQCGIDCIGVTFGFGDREELEDAGAKHVVDRVEELLPLLL